MRKCGIYRGEILPYDNFTSFTVTLSNELLDLGSRFLARQHAAQREEAGLHDRIDAVTELAVSSNTVRIYRINPELLLDDHLLHGRQQVVPHVFVRTIDQQSRALDRCVENVVLTEKRELMHSD